MFLYELVDESINVALGNPELRAGPCLSASAMPPPPTPPPPAASTRLGWASLSGTTLRDGDYVVDRDGRACQKQGSEESRTGKGNS